MRLVMEAIAGLLGGLAGWFVVGFLAAQLFTSVGGSREGANAMGGFFFIGPLGGIAGFAIAFLLARKYLEMNGAATLSPGSFATMAISLGVVIAVGAALLGAVAALRKPEATVNLYGGEEGSIEIEIIVPGAVLAGRSPADVIGLSLVAIEGDGERNEKVAWSETPGREGVTLAGHALIRERTRELYFAITVNGDEFKLYPEVPENMHRKGHWVPRLYLGRDAATAPGDMVRATCRYLPPRE